MIAILTVLASLLGSAHASEGTFGYVYTLDNTPKGNWEYEQKQTYRTGKARGHYHAVDLRNEFEYGITDNFQVAFYLNSLYIDQAGVPDVDDTTIFQPTQKEFNIRGGSVEFIYRLLSPYKDGIGLGLYSEWEVSTMQRDHANDSIERAVEFRVILQKNFLDDQLVTAFNVMAEPEWIRNNGLTTTELYIEFNAAASYRFTSNWFLGLEARNHMEYVQMNLGNQEHSAWFAGPTLHYGAQAWWATLTVLPQLTGWPRTLGDDANGDAISDRVATLAEHERVEVRFMFGIPLGEGHSHEHN